MIDELSWANWTLLFFGALLMGLGKGGVPGIGNLTIAIYALVLEEALGAYGVAVSVGLLLPVLISGDLTSTIVYRRSVEWIHLRTLLPSFLTGVFLGWLTFDFFQLPENVSLLKSFIGILLLSLTGLRLVYSWFEIASKKRTTSPVSLFGSALGIVGGLATMLANAAGPIAQFYLLVKKLPKDAFIGTSAWLFLIVNLSKFPLMWELGLLDLSVLKICLWLFPWAILGVLIAPKMLRFIRQDWFERIIWFFIVVAGIRMIL